MNWEQAGWAVFAITGLLCFWAEVRLSHKVGKLIKEAKQLLQQVEERQRR